MGVEGSGFCSYSPAWDAVSSPRAGSHSHRAFLARTSEPELQIRGFWRGALGLRADGLRRIHGYRLRSPRPPQRSENVTVPEALRPTQPGTLDRETQTQTPSRKSRILNPSTRALARESPCIAGHMEQDADAEFMAAVVVGLRLRLNPSPKYDVVASECTGRLGALGSTCWGEAYCSSICRKGRFGTLPRRT